MNLLAETQRAQYGGVFHFEANKDGRHRPSRQDEIFLVVDDHDHELLADGILGTRAYSDRKHEGQCYAETPTELDQMIHLFCSSQVLGADVSAKSTVCH
jgi:hypothetical protein